ncbi:hypothetical protein LJC48_02265 [Desulfovibrio sp. OttesenSCG-928-C06]|nr:hypothetical protein [Desulfovibrio sp. OttesenSCG-928-C06]
MRSERIDIAGIIPHRQPMLMIDSVSLGSSPDDFLGGSPDGSADRAWVTVRDDCPALDDAGLIIGAAFFEIMAQGFAAINAVRAMQGGQVGLDGQEGVAELPKAGFLVGVKKFACHGSAAPGDELYVSIGKSSALGPFHVFDASVWAAGTDSVGGAGTISTGTATTSDVAGNAGNTGSTGHTGSADNDVLLASGQVKIFLLEGDGLPTEALQA